MSCNPPNKRLQPICPRRSDESGSSEQPHYSPLPKIPRELANKKCDRCREAKQKCKPGPVQGSGCQRCHQRGLPCPGLTKARAASRPIDYHNLPVLTLLDDDIFQPCLPKQEYRASLMEKRRAASSKSTTFTLYRRSAQYPDVQTCDFSSYADEVIEDIHKLRPCLPCQWLGTKCTDVDPSGTCGTCRVLFNKELQFDVLRALVDKKLQSDALSSIYCIRLLFKDMKLYQSDYSDPELLSRTSYLESSEIHLEFEVVGTTLESLVETARVWLAKTDDHSMSMVGLLSSKKFSDLAESFLGKNLVADLREFLYATSLAHVREIPDTEDQDHSTYEMRVTAAYRGRKILDYLDWILSPQSLNRASQDELRAYFLAVLLTTLGVGYSVPLQDSPALFEPMREQLCDMLSARLILIGSKLDIRFHPDIQRKLLISAVNHWGKEAYFTWSQRTTAELPMYSTLRLPLPPYPEENIYRKFGFELCRRNTASWIDKDECTCVKNCPPGRGCRFALI